MGLRAEFDKFKKHLSYGGLGYTVMRGLRYLGFLLKHKTVFGQPMKAAIGRGKLKAEYLDRGVRFFWNNQEISRFNGINIGVNTFGMWTDSTKATSELVSNEGDRFTMRVVFSELPLVLECQFAIIDGNTLALRIDMEAEEWLSIDELRISFLFDGGFGGWAADFRQGRFPEFGEKPQDIFLSESSSGLVAVTPTESVPSLPVIMIEPREKGYRAFIQSSAAAAACRVVGFRFVGTEETKEFSAGSHRLCDGSLSFSDGPELLYEKMKALRLGGVEETLPSSCCLGDVPLQVKCVGKGIELYWQGELLSCLGGLNTGAYAYGVWTDSTKASWTILESTPQSLKLSIRFFTLPITQFWTLAMKDPSTLYWQIDMEAEDWCTLDEFRLVCLLPQSYSEWFCENMFARFPEKDQDWHDVFVSEAPSKQVALARGPEEGEYPPFFIEQLATQLHAFIQNPAAQVEARVVGYCDRQRREYAPGRYQLFSGCISFLPGRRCLQEKFPSSFSLCTEKTAPQAPCSDTRLKRPLKVLLVNLPWHKDGVWGVRAGSRWPHIKDTSEGNYLPYPFFLGHATTLLQRHGIDAHVIDAIAEQIPEEEFVPRLLKMDFDYLVAETSVPSWADDMRILENLYRCGVSIILCGPDTRIYQEQFLKEHVFIRFVLFGEYEATLLELIATLQKNGAVAGVRGLIWRDGSRVVKNPPRPLIDITQLPWPERQELPMAKYWDLPGNIPYPSVQMLASRGCPFGCSFCLWPQVMYQGGSYRTRDMKDVVDEMQYLVTDRGFKSVYFDDDTFNIGRERMLAFCKQVQARGLTGIPWAAMARADLMDAELLQEMKRCGLWAVKYGVESCVDSLIENYQKKLDLQKTTDVIRRTQDLGIKVHLTFSFGIDGETEETIKRTIDYALKMDPESVQFSILTPFPGTRLFNELDAAGRIITKDWSKYDGHYNCVFKPDILSPLDLVNAKRTAYRLWGESKRRKRGFRGDIRRFQEYCAQYGTKAALCKVMQYLDFVLIKRTRYLDGKG